MGPLEDKLNKALVKDAPFQLPENTKKSIVQYLPIINLVLGVISLWAAYSLWHWAHIANNAVDYVNRLSTIYGTPEVAKVSRLSTMVWVSLIVVLAEGVLYVASYPGLKARSKSGWNFVFYGILLNLVYGIVGLFNDYAGASNLIGTLVGTVIGLYILFQIRSAYTGAKSAAKASPKETAEK